MKENIKLFLTVCWLLVLASAAMIIFWHSLEWPQTYILGGSGVIAIMIRLTAHFLGVNKKTVHQKENSEHGATR